MQTESGEVYKSWKTSYGITRDMHLTGRISYRYIRNVTANKKCFARYEYGKIICSILKTLEGAEHIKSLNIPSRSINLETEGTASDLLDLGQKGRLAMSTL